MNIIGFGLILAGLNGHFKMSQPKVNYPYMIFLSLVAAIGGFLFGYDTAVISGTVIQVSKQFGLNSLDQGWYVGCALLGCIFGVSIAGVLSDRFGRKNIMLLSAILFTISALGCALTQSFTGLVLYRILGGVGIGMISIISPMYISEVAVSEYRGSLVSLYQLAITIGFLGAYLVNFQLLEISQSSISFAVPVLDRLFKEEVWRGMLGMEFIPAMAFFCVLFFIPESPRWLIIRKSTMEAELVFIRIYNSVELAKTKVQEVLSTRDLPGKADFRTLLAPGVFRPVMIGAAIAILGQFMGVNAVLYYGPAIFEQSGLSGGDALFYQVLVGLVNALTTVIALVIIDKVGRKKLVYFGVTGMIISLVLIGFYFLKGAVLAIPEIFLLVLFLAYIFFTAISISAVIFVLLSEMYPNKVRGIAMSVAGLSLWVGTYLIGQLTPWFLDNLGPSGTFFLFAFMCFPYLFIIWKMVPETAGKSLEEIERFWLAVSSKK